MSSRSSSHHFASLVLVLIVGCLVSCSTTTQEQSGAVLRKEGYEALLETIKPGMYRRQLYAVLPPCAKPMAQPPSMSFSKGGSTMHQEMHKLDDDCVIIVHYQLKNGKEYTEPHSASLPLPHSKTKLDQHTEITPDSIDELLSAEYAKPRTVPSMENRDDIIFSVSNVRIHTDANFVDVAPYTPFPTQEHGFLVGRHFTTQKGSFIPTRSNGIQGTPSPHLPPPPRN